YREALLRESQKDVSWKMIQNICHEFRNPSVAVNGFVRRIRNTTSREKIMQYCDLITKEVAGLEQKCNAMQEYLEPVQLSPDFYSINRIISNAIVQSENKFREYVIDGTIKINYTPIQDHVTHCDGNKVAQAIVHIIEGSAEKVNGKSTQMDFSVSFGENYTYNGTTIPKYVNISTLVKGLYPAKIELETIEEPLTATDQNPTEMHYAKARKLIEANNGRFLVNPTKQGLQISMILPHITREEYSY
ncbi:MAG: hypothetical protein ABIF10_08150, partial [Candidatus Woesearchaeota archaeon]